MSDKGPYVFDAIIATICFVISIIFVGKTLSHLKEKGSISTKGDKCMLSLSLIIMIMFLIHEFVSIIDYVYSAANGKQNEALGATGVLYFLGRIFLYSIFIHRLNYIIQQSVNPYSKKTIRIIYGILGILCFSIFLLVIGFFTGTLPLVYIGGFSWIFFDICFCIVLPILFINKLYELVQFQKKVILLVIKLIRIIIIIIIMHLIEIE